MSAETTYTEYQPETSIRTPLEFSGHNGFVLRQLTPWDSRELITKNQDTKFLPTLKVIQTEADALNMITNPDLAIFGTENQAGLLVGLTTLAKEKELNEYQKKAGFKDTGHMLSMGGVVDKDFRRQGIRSNTIKTVAANISTIGSRFFDMPEVETIRCYVRSDNKASRKVLELCGFSLQGERPNVNVYYDLDIPTEAPQG
jgi:ribosomal protein S18 acetylase RimI-like enzyme